MGTRRRRGKRSGGTAKSRGARWAYLTRAGSEQDVLDELDGVKAERLATGLVLASRRVMRPDGTPIVPAFARQAMRTEGRRVSARPEPVATALAKVIHSAYPDDRRWPWTLQVVVPDSRDPQDPRRAQAREIDETIAEHLDARLERRIAEAFVDDPEEADRLAQVWLIDPSTAIIGFTPSQDALTVVPGGRIKLDREEDSPSRSGLKLREAIGWIGVGPDRGDTVAYLGAAPGGWTSVAVKRGAKVVAVDYKPLAVKLPPKKIRFVGADAFAYVPDETYDWLLCDLSARPLDVAKLIAKWGRRVWARQVIASFKLPMKRKADTLARILSTIEGGGYNGVRARQLFHDRNEVTVFGWLDPRAAGRNYRRERR